MFCSSDATDGYFEIFVFLCLCKSKLKYYATVITLVFALQVTTYAYSLTDRREQASRTP